MHKKLYLLITTLVLCLALLVGVFLIVPKTTQAKAPYTPISVTQPGQCAQLAALYDTQTCVMTVSMSQSVKQNVHFSVSYSAVSCYATCAKELPVEGVAVALPQGNTLYPTYNQVQVVIIAPLSTHGSLTITFAVSGPSNTVKTQLVVSNSAG